MEELKWSEQRSGEGSLKEVTDARIRFMIDLPSGEDPWSAVFAPRKRPLYDYMVERTFLRPRDLIKFCNVSLTAAQAATAASSSIAYAHVELARPSYSSYLLEELDNEVYQYYPEWRHWLELLRVIGSQAFSRRVFTAVCTQNPGMTSGRTPKEILEVVYRFGILSFARLRPDGTMYAAWQVRDRGVQFNPNASYFRVHSGLLDAIGLRPTSVEAFRTQELQERRRNVQPKKTRAQKKEKEKEKKKKRSGAQQRLTDGANEAHTAKGSDKNS